MQRKQNTSTKPQVQATQQIEALQASGTDALFALQVDSEVFRWFRSLMWVISREAESEQSLSLSRRTIKDLADIGNYLADDRLSVLIDECKRLQDALDNNGVAK